MQNYIEAGYAKRGLIRKSACPFCGLSIEKPRELQTRRYGEMPVGSCSCGAVYAYDATGHNLGAAFIEALVFGCDMNWDLAWELLPGEDYLEQVVENYDLESNLVVPGGSFEGRRISGALYFVRLHRDIQKVTEDGVRKKLDRATPISAGTPTERVPGRAFTKAEIEEMVKTYNYTPLLNMDRPGKRTLRYLQRLLCAGDELTRLRTAEILGKVSAVIARDEPGAVSNLLQELFNALTDTAASSWGAVDAAGEIIRNSPGLFAGYIPKFYQLLEDDRFRPGVLRAIGLTAETRPDLMRNATFRLLPYLRDPAPAARGYAAWIYGNLGVAEAERELERLKNDHERVFLYSSGSLKETTVGHLAAEALEKLRHPKN